MTYRLFAALPLPDAVTERVLPLMDHVPGAKWRPEENLHITLAFYGDMDGATAEELDHELARIRVAPFDLRLKGARHFGKAEPTSLWLGVEGGEALPDLARRCAKAGKAAGVPPERRVYTPHLTLAYLGRDVDIVKLQRFEQSLNLYTSETWRADRFHLYSSHTRKPGKPNAYEIEAEYPLER